MFAILFVIFQAIVNFIIAIVKFVLSILNYFGLTIPIFYFLFMLILNVFLKGVIFDTYYTLYIIGFVLSFVLCIIYFLRKFFFKKNRRIPKFNYRKVRQTQQQQQADGGLIPSGNIIQERVFRDPNGNIVQERTFQMPDSVKVKAYPLENDKQPEVYEEYKALESPKTQLKTVGSFNEDPVIYRVKNNKQYIIKEYSDRVEVYKETPHGYEFIKCDYK